MSGAALRIHVWSMIPAPPPRGPIPMNGMDFPDPLRSNPFKGVKKILSEAPSRFHSSIETFS